MKNNQAHPIHNPCTTRAQALRARFGAGAALLTVMALSACSPGGVVAGTIGAAGAVAGTAVDVVLRGGSKPGAIE